MKKGKKIHKNRLFTKYPDQTSHAVETTDKIIIVFSLCKCSRHLVFWSWTF